MPEEGSDLGNGFSPRAKNSIDLEIALAVACFRGFVTAARNAGIDFRPAELRAGIQEIESQARALCLINSTAVIPLVRIEAYFPGGNESVVDAAMGIRSALSALLREGGG